MGQQQANLYRAVIFSRLTAARKDPTCAAARPYMQATGAIEKQESRLGPLRELSYVASLHLRWSRETTCCRVHLSSVSPKACSLTLLH
jgi:hypothetical protein